MVFRWVELRQGCLKLAGKQHKIGALRSKPSAVFEHGDGEGRDSRRLNMRKWGGFGLI